MTAGPGARSALFKDVNWSGSTVVILASGPSLSEAQCAAVKEWRQAETERARRVIAINNTFRRALWADMLYACDVHWWAVYLEEARATFAGELWTQDVRAQREHRIKYVESSRANGLGKRPGVIHQGGNSGYQAINLAYQAGAEKIVLAGFDMHGTHWHGKHGHGLPNTADWLFKLWVKNFDALAADLAAEGVDVVNCSPDSALRCFRAAKLDAELT